MAEDITLRLPKLMPEQDACCDRFEAAWKAAGTAGAPPRIEDYLGDPGPVRAVLLHELTALDLVYRRRRGETPPAEEYLSRFPELRPDWLAQELTSAPEPVTATRTTDGASPVQRMRCPHCHNPIALADHHGDEVLCPGCGGSFRVRDASLTDTTSASRPMGKFALLQRVGQGAFGAVWKARDTVLSRVVALKIPHAGRLTEAEELERFHREARAAAQLRHPGIVPVYEVLTLEGLPVIVSEFVEGVTLKDFLEVRKLPFHESAALMANLADALDYAHQMGLVHRDIKPANIMMENARQGDETGQTTQRRTLLMDFGLALRDEAEVTLTLDGQLIGTPAYMSPEQAAGRGHTADRRSDVYGLGVVFYELLTGELPFRGSKAMMLYQVLAENPQPPRKVNEKIPRDLETICLKCLRKEPEKRYRSARELADDLRRWQVGEPIQARPVGRVERTVKWVRRNPVVAALLVMVVLAIAAGLGAFSVKYYDAVEQTLIANSERTKAEEQAEIARTQTAIALTQTSLAETRRQQAEGLVKAKDKALAKADEENRKAQEQLAANAIIMAQAAWEKGDAVAAQAHLDAVPDGPLKLRNIEWHYLRRKYEGCLFSLPKQSSAVSAIAFSPDGQRLATTCQHGTTRLWDARTGLPAVQLEQALGIGKRTIDLAFSSDGMRLRAVRSDNTIHCWDTNNGTLVQTVELKATAQWLDLAAFNSDGTRLATAVTTGPFINRALTIQSWDTTTGQQLNGFKGIKGYMQQIAFSPDGTRLATLGGMHRQQVELWDTRSGKMVLPLEQYAHAMAFSPDGATVATLSYYPEPRVNLWNSQTGALSLACKAAKVEGRRVGTFNSSDLRMAFSPDGRRLAALAADNRILVWDPTTGEFLFVLRGSKDVVSRLAFSPNGARLATGDRDGTVRIWDARTDRSAPDFDFVGPASNASFSRDGTRVATSEYGKPPKLWDARTGKAMLAFNGQSGVTDCMALSPDGRQFASASNAGMIRMWDVNTDAILRTFECPDTGDAGTPQGRVRSMAFSLDGHLIAAAIFNGEVNIWDVNTAALVTNIARNQARYVESLVFSPDGKYLALGTAGYAAHVSLWNTRMWKMVWQFDNADWTGGSVEFSPDSRRLATCGRMGARLWDVATGKPILDLKGHNAPVDEVIFSPDGSRLMTSSKDGTVRLWDTRSGIMILTLLEFQSAWSKKTLSFSQDGKRMFAVIDGHIRCLNLHTGAIDPDELAYRKWMTRPDPEWHGSALSGLYNERDRFGRGFHFRKLIDLRPTWAVSYSGLDGITPSQALDAFRVAIEREPMSAALRLRRGLYYSRLQRFEEALTDLNRAAQLAKADPFVVFARSLVYGRAGRVQEGRSARAQALRHFTLPSLDAERGLQGRLNPQTGNWDRDSSVGDTLYAIKEELEWEGHRETILHEAGRILTATSNLGSLFSTTCYLMNPTYGASWSGLEAGAGWKVCGMGFCSRKNVAENSVQLFFPHLILSAK